MLNPIVQGYRGPVEVDCSHLEFVFSGILCSHLQTVWPLMLPSQQVIDEQQEEKLAKHGALRDTAYDGGFLVCCSVFHDLLSSAC